MSAATVASSISSPHHSFDTSHRAHSIHMTTESPAAPRRNKAPRQRPAPALSTQHGEIQSDSNLLVAHTPKAKKPRQRQADNRAAVSGSEAPNPRTASRPQRSNKMPANKDTPALLATPAKNLAYASAAFHQSPAASSLPIPKFLSKSVPAQAPDNSLQARLDHEPDKSSASPSPPVAAATPDPLAREKSPLDMFFNADRQERAKGQGGPNFGQGHDSPFMSVRSPVALNKDMFMMEMDQPNSPSGKPFARPNHAPRMTSAPGQVPVSNQNDAAVAATQSLKDFLKLPSQPTPQQQQQPPPQQPFSNGSPAQSYHQQNPFVTTTPQQQSHADSRDSNLHYGNRNLSPLFQAARSPNAGPVPTANSPFNGRTPIKQSQPFDPRAFIDQQTRAAPSDYSSFSPAQAHRNPNVNYSNHGQFDPAYYAHPASPSARMVPNPGPPANHNQSPSRRLPPDSPRENHDVNDMSAKLRGMLNLGF